MTFNFNLHPTPTTYFQYTQCPVPYSLALPLIYNISFLVPGDGTATKCYLCTKLIGGSAEDDSCGSFDSKTPTCNLNEGGICWKQYEKR